MSFGTQYIKGNEKDKFQKLKITEEDYKENDNASQIEKQKNIISNSFNSSKSKESRFNRLKSSSKKNKPSTTKETNTSRNYQIENSHHLLVAKAVRLIQEVGDFQKWTQKKIQFQKDKAHKEPQKVIDALGSIYNKTINEKEKSKKSFQKETEKNPNINKLMIIKKNKTIIKEIKNEQQKILRGAILESIPYEYSCFPPPSELF